MIGNLGVLALAGRVLLLLDLGGGACGLVAPGREWKLTIFSTNDANNHQLSEIALLTSPEDDWIGNGPAGSIGDVYTHHPVMSCPDCYGCHTGGPAELGWHNGQFTWDQQCDMVGCPRDVFLTYSYAIQPTRLLVGGNDDTPATGYPTNQRLFVKDCSGSWEPYGDTWGHAPPAGPNQYAASSIPNRPALTPCFSCTDGLLNQGETQADCGGPCPACPVPCQVGTACCNEGVWSDELQLCQRCAKGTFGKWCEKVPGDIEFLNPMTCPDDDDEARLTWCGLYAPNGPQDSSCTDSTRGGDETGVDCGGSCLVTCPSCVDTSQNGDETGADCGGSCPCPCPKGSPGKLFFDPPHVTYEEDCGKATLTVVRMGGTDHETWVSFSTFDGSASEGSDYGYASGTLVWPDTDATNREIEVDIFDDGEEECQETVLVELHGAQCAWIGPVPVGTITINFNDIPCHSPGLVGYWTFDEGAGAVAYDNSCVGGSDGDLLGGISYVPRRHGFAVENVDGGDSRRVEILPFGTLPTGGKPYTISVWMDLTSLTGTRYALFTGEQLCNKATSIAFQQEGTDVVDDLVRTAWWCVDLDVHVGANLVGHVSQFHVVITYEDVGSSPKRELWFNGVSHGGDNPALHNAKGGPSIIVGCSASLTECMHGSIDDLRIYNRKLTDPEIEELYYGYCDSQCRESDDRGTVAMLHASRNVNEPDLKITITGQRSGGNECTVRARVTFSDISATQGSDYNREDNSVSLGYGFMRWEDGGSTLAKYVVSITDDAISESNEVFKATISSPYHTTIVGLSKTSITIISDE